MASRKPLGKETHRDVDFLSAIIRNSNIDTDWAAVGKDIGNPAPCGPSERWFTLQRRVTFLQGIRIRPAPRKRNQVKETVGKKGKSKGKNITAVGAGGNGKFGAGVGTRCTLVHSSLYTGCIYMGLTPHKPRNEVVNLQLHCNSWKLE
jgi:hypothetical protein